MTRKEKVEEILKRLYLFWPQPTTELIHNSPFELLIAVMLSAQTTDKIVNTVTPNLFRQFNTIQSLADAPVEQIHALVKKVNYSSTKARHIKETAKIILDKFNGNVPKTMNELVTLPGVGRKTANVVLGDAFNNPIGIVVDTHVARLSKALGLTDKKTPQKIEEDLMKIVPKDKWRDFSHLLILFGRYKCPARMKLKDSEVLGDLGKPIVC